MEQRIIMKKILYLTAISLTAGIVWAAGTYSKTVFYDDVSVGTWTAAGPLTATYTTGGTYTNGAYTNYYRLNGTNLQGRLPNSTVFTNSWTGTTNASNAVVLHWPRKDGPQQWVIETSTNGVQFTNWVFVTGGTFITTNYTDYGTNSWTHTYFTNLYSEIGAITVPWTTSTNLDEYVKTNHTAGNVSVSGRVSVGAQKMFASLPGASQGDIELSVYKVDGYGPSIAVVGGTGEYMDYGWQYTNGATTNMFTLTMETAGSILTLYSYHNDVWSSMLSIYTNGTWNFRDNSITNIGLAEASSLQLGPVSATVTNISDSSSTSSSNELMTAHAIDTKVNQHADGAFFSLWFDTNAHSSVVGYGIMSSDIVATTQTVALVNVTNNQILGVCASEITDFNPSQLYGGHPIEVEIYAYNPSAGGDKDVAIKVNVYKRTGATEVLLGTTTTTPVIDEATISEYIMDFLLQTNVSWTSGVDILVAKGIAVVTGSGGAPELNYVFGGQYDTSLGVPIPAGDFVFKTDFVAGTNTVTDAFVAADAVVTNAMAAQSNNLSAVDAVKANTNHYGEIVASRFKGRITVLDESDSTPTWDATNTFSTLNVTQNVTITISNFEAGITYTTRIYNNASKSIAWDSAIDWVGDELAELKTNIITFISFDGVRAFATGKGY